MSKFKCGACGGNFVGPLAHVTVSIDYNGKSKQYDIKICEHCYKRIVNVCDPGNSED